MPDTYPNCPCCGGTAQPAVCNCVAVPAQYDLTFTGPNVTSNEVCGGEQPGLPYPKFAMLAQTYRLVKNPPGAFVGGSAWASYGYTGAVVYPICAIQFDRPRVELYCDFSVFGTTTRYWYLRFIRSGSGFEMAAWAKPNWRTGGTWDCLGVNTLPLLFTQGFSSAQQALFTGSVATLTPV